jgi:hypothetical protein
LSGSAKRPIRHSRSPEIEYKSSRGRRMPNSGRERVGQKSRARFQRRAN